MQDITSSMPLRFSIVFKLQVIRNSFCKLLIL